jgi:hypothetical protein
MLPVCGAGTVLITFKSRLSLPPYRIENATSDVAIWFAQVRVSAPQHQSAELDGTAAACQGHKAEHTGHLGSAMQHTDSAKALAPEVASPHWVQDELKGSDAHWNWLTARPGGASMPFAWDEPLAPHRLRVHVRFDVFAAAVLSSAAVSGHQPTWCWPHSAGHGCAVHLHLALAGRRFHAI